LYDKRRNTRLQEGLDTAGGSGLYSALMHAIDH
jgi:hypothetical protein